MFFDNEGKNKEENINKGWRNINEGKFIINFILKLLEKMDKSNFSYPIGIVTPYV